MSADPSREPRATLEDLTQVFQDACDEVGCRYDNEALLQAIADLKKSRLPDGNVTEAPQPVAWQLRIARDDGTWFDWDCIDQDEYNLYRDHPSKGAQVRPLYTVSVPAVVRDAAVADKCMSCGKPKAGHEKANCYGYVAPPTDPSVEAWQKANPGSCISCGAGLTAALSQPAPVEVWQDIKTAPKDGRGILAKLPHSDMPHTIFWRRDAWRVAWDGYQLKGLDAPTHWMPVTLPATSDNET